MQSQPVSGPSGSPPPSLPPSPIPSPPPSPRAASKPSRGVWQKISSAASSAASGVAAVASAVSAPKEALKAMAVSVAATAIYKSGSGGKVFNRFIKQQISDNLKAEAFDSLIEVFVPLIVPIIREPYKKTSKSSVSNAEKLIIDFVLSPAFETNLQEMIKTGLHNLAEHLRKFREESGDGNGRPVRLVDVLVYALHCIKNKNTEEVQKELSGINLKRYKEKHSHLPAQDLKELVDAERAEIIMRMFRPLIQQAFPQVESSSLNLIELIQPFIGKYYDVISEVIDGLESEHKLEAEVPGNLKQLLTMLPGLASYTIVPLAANQIQSELRKTEANKVADIALGQFELLMAMPKDFYETRAGAQSAIQKIEDDYKSKLEKLDNKNLKDEFIIRNRFGDERGPLEEQQAKTTSCIHQIENELEKLKEELRGLKIQKEYALSEYSADAAEQHKKNEEELNKKLEERRRLQESLKLIEEELVKLETEKATELGTLQQEYELNQKRLAAEEEREKERPPAIAKEEVLNQLALECAALADTNDPLKKELWADLQKIGSLAVTKILKSAFVNLGKDALQQGKASETLGDLILYGIDLFGQQSRALDQFLEELPKEQAQDPARSPSRSLSLFLPLLKKAFPRGKDDLPIGKLSDHVWTYLSTSPSCYEAILAYFKNMSSEYEPENTRFFALDSGRNIFLQGLSGVSADAHLMPMIRTLLQKKKKEIGKSIGEVLAGNSLDGSGLWAREVESLSAGEDPARQALWQFIQHTGFGAFKQILADALKNIGREPGKDAPPKLADLFSQILTLVHTKYLTLQKQLSETRDNLKGLNERLEKEHNQELVKVRDEAQQEYEKLVQDLFKPLLDKAFPLGAKNLTALNFFGESAKQAVWALLNKPDALVQLYEMYVVQLEQIHQDKALKPELISTRRDLALPVQQLMTLLFTEEESKVGREYPLGNLLQGKLQDALRDPSNAEGWAKKLIDKLGIKGKNDAQVGEEIAAFATSNPLFWKYLQHVGLGTILDITARALSKLSVLDKQPPPTVAGIITSSIHCVVEAHTKEKEAELEYLRQQVTFCKQAVELADKRDKDLEEGHEKAIKAYGLAVKGLFQPLLNIAFPSGIKDLNLGVFETIFGKAATQRIWDFINDPSHYIALYHAIIQLDMDFGVEDSRAAEEALPKELLSLLEHLPGRVISTVSDSLAGRMRDPGKSQEMAVSVVSKIFKRANPHQNLHDLDVEIRTLASKQDAGGRLLWSFLERVGKGMLYKMLTSLLVKRSNSTSAGKLQEVGSIISQVFNEQIFATRETEHKGKSEEIDRKRRIDGLFEQVHTEERNIQKRAGEKEKKIHKDREKYLQELDELAQKEIFRLLENVGDNFQPVLKSLLSEFGAESIAKHPVIGALLKFALPAQKAEENERKMSIDEASQEGSVYERGVSYLVQTAAHSYWNYSKSSLDIQGLRNQLAKIYPKKTGNDAIDVASDCVSQIRELVKRDGATWIARSKEVMAKAFVGWLIPETGRVAESAAKAQLRAQLENLFTEAFGALAEALKSPSPALKHLWDKELCDVLEHFLLKSILSLSHVFQKFDTMAQDNPERNVLLQFLDRVSLPQTSSHLIALNNGIAQASGWRSFWPRQVHDISFSELTGENQLGDMNSIVRVIEKFLKEEPLTRAEQAFIPRNKDDANPKVQVVKGVLNWMKDHPCTPEEEHKYKFASDQQKGMFKLNKEVLLTDEEERLCASSAEKLKLKLHKKVLEVRNGRLFNWCLHPAVRPVHISEMDLKRISDAAEAEATTADEIRLLKDKKLQELQEKRQEEQRRAGLYEPVAKALIKLIFPDTIKSVELTDDQEARCKTVDDVFKRKLEKAIERRKAQVHLSAEELEHLDGNDPILDKCIKLTSEEEAYFKYRSTERLKYKHKKLEEEVLQNEKDAFQLQIEQHLPSILGIVCKPLFFDSESLNRIFETFLDKQLQQDQFEFGEVQLKTAARALAKHLKREALNQEEQTFIPLNLKDSNPKAHLVKEVLRWIDQVPCTSQEEVEHKLSNDQNKRFFKLDKAVQLTPEEDRQCLSSEEKLNFKFYKKLLAARDGTLFDSGAGIPAANGSWRETLEQIGVALPPTIRQLILKIPFNGKTLQENFPPEAAREKISQLFQTWSLIQITGTLLESTANTMRNSQAQGEQDVTQQHERISGKFKSWVEKVVETLAIRKFGDFGRWTISPERANSQRLFDRIIVYANATAKRIYNLVAAIFKILIWPLQLLGTVLKDGFLYYQCGHIVENNTHEIHKNLVAQFVTGLAEKFVELAQELPADQPARKASR